MLAVAAGQVQAQHPDDHAEAITRASCIAGRQSEAVKSASAAFEREPDELGARLQLADLLVDQGCYQEAVSLLEAGVQEHPHSNELTAKLRNIRSLVTEQTYIENLTQAAEGAKLQRNQLRCTRLADVTACEDALKSKPDDPQLLLAKGDALVQANRPAEAVTAYKRATQLKPADEGLKTKLASAEALQANAAAAAKAAALGTAAGAVASLAAPTAGAPASATGIRVAAGDASTDHAAGDATGTARRSLANIEGPAPKAARARRSSTPAAPPVEPPLPSVASIEPPPTRIYSNQAPPGQSN
jgi:predicted Zn-dependent protease